MTTALQYRRVSTSEQGDSGLGLAAQAFSIEDYARRNDITISGDFVEVKSGGNATNRRELQKVLQAMRNGEADLLIVSHVSRLARNISDLSQMITQATQFKYGIVCLDTGLDTTTPAGRLVVQMLGVAAEYERAITSERVTRAMAEAKKQGRHMGRPEAISVEALVLISSLRRMPKINLPASFPRMDMDKVLKDARERQKDPAFRAARKSINDMMIRAELKNHPATFVEIARALEALEIPAPSGGKTWHVSTVTRAAKRLAAVAA